jgi:RNA polymerase sigma-70 factor (ECF subfamily)
MSAAEVVLEGERHGAGPPQGLEARFAALAAEYGAAIQRVARGYEADEGRQQDLAQEILVALWTALPAFEGRSTIRTWVYRIAHNVAVSHVLRRRRDRLARAVPVDDDTMATVVRNAVREVEGRDAVHRLAAAVRALRPVDAQVILLYLEGLAHAEIADVTGLTPENAAVKVHRIKAALARALDDGGAR